MLDPMSGSVRQGCADAQWQSMCSARRRDLARRAGMGSAFAVSDVPAPAFLRMNAEESDRFMRIVKRWRYGWVIFSFVAETITAVSSLSTLSAGVFAVGLFSVLAILTYPAIVRASWESEYGVPLLSP